MPLEFNEQEKAQIDEIVGRYPRKAAALLPVLHLTQHKFGHLSLEAQVLVAKTLEVAPARVHEVVTFYEMYHEHPEGQFHLEFCTNISCFLLGGKELLAHAKDRLGIEVGHHTEDGIFSLMETECLASCGSGPMMKVGEDYYEYLTPEAVDGLIERFRKQAKSLNGRPYVCAEGGPHTGPVPGFEPKLPVIQPNQAAPAKAPEKPEANAKPEEAKPQDEAKVEDKAEDKSEAPAEAKAEDKAEPKAEPEASKKPTSGKQLPSFDPPPLKKEGKD